MQVILLDKIAKLGGLGDQVSVKAGYARNFLIPQGKAVMATKANIEAFGARRAELEAKLANAQVIDPSTLDAEGRVVFGATVELEDLESAQTVRYQIVGDDEADLKLSKISISSPIARALIGKYAGDVAQVQAPSGVREYEVIDVLYI